MFHPKANVYPSSMRNFGQMALEIDYYYNKITTHTASKMFYSRHMNKLTATLTQCTTCTFPILVCTLGRKN